MRGTVIPDIEAARGEGFRHIDLMRRAEGQEIEFVTIMWFDDIAAVKRFAGDDYEVSHVPAMARAVLAHFRRSGGTLRGARPPAAESEHHAAACG